MSEVKKGRKPNISINGEKLKRDLTKCFRKVGIEYTSQKVSMALGKHHDFFAKCLRTNKMSEAELKRLCALYSLKKEYYLIEEEIKDAEKAADVNESVNGSGQQKPEFLKGDKPIVQIVMTEEMFEYITGKLDAIQGVHETHCWEFFDFARDFMNWFKEQFVSLHEDQIKLGTMIANKMNETFSEVKTANLNINGNTNATLAVKKVLSECISQSRR